MNQYSWGWTIRTHSVSELSSKLYVSLKYHIPIIITGKAGKGYQTSSMSLLVFSPIEILYSGAGGRLYMWRPCVFLWVLTAVGYHLSSKSIIVWLLAKGLGDWSHCKPSLSIWCRWRKLMNPRQWLIGRICECGPTGYSYCARHGESTLVIRQSVSASSTFDFLPRSLVSLSIHRVYRNPDMGLEHVGAWVWGRLRRANDHGYNCRLI